MYSKNDGIRIDEPVGNVLLVRRRWDSLKATYMRSKKRIPSGSAGNEYHKYKYATLLSFLDDTAEPRISRQIGGASTSADYSGASQSVSQSGSAESTNRPSKSNCSNLFINKIRNLILLGKSKDEDGMDTKRRFVDLLEKKYEAKAKAVNAATNNDDDVDMELKGFSMMLNASLRSLPRAKRLKLQSQMLQLVAEDIEAD